ncbi:hypothetical protein [Nonomuraea dietziae]|uniref:hypothetical protein n=1 Tax=Nonomuraea dietziae TaxID=65515 RepID=UPI0031CEF257
MSTSLFVIAKEDGQWRLTARSTRTWAFAPARPRTRRSGGGWQAENVAHAERRA